MNWVEPVAALLGLANIVLIVRRSVWNYMFGLLMVTLCYRQLLSMLTARGQI